MLKIFLINMGIMTFWSWFIAKIPKAVAKDTKKDLNLDTKLKLFFNVVTAYLFNLIILAIFSLLASVIINYSIKFVESIIYA